MLAIFLVYLSLYLTVNKYRWNLFTRVVSTINAINCVYLTPYLFWSDLYDLNYIPANIDYITGILFSFVAYLAVDGFFVICEFIINPSGNLFTSMLHHIVGGYGIYLIA